MIKIIILFFFLCFTVSTNLSAETNGKLITPKKYDVGNLGKLEKGIKLTKSADKLEKKKKIEKARKKYEKALEYFLLANKENNSDVEIFNYLGYIYSKLGEFSNSEIYYLLVLSINPEHEEANGHLGELYFKTNRLDLAKERLSVLKNCDCVHYQLLKKIIVQ